MTTSKAIMLLVHQGFSFVEEISTLVKEAGLGLCILTSKPQNPDRIELISGLTEHVCVSEHTALQQSDVDTALALLKSRNIDLISCIATYEGYRLLMAEVNSNCNALDSSVSSIAKTLDKYSFRKELFDAGISQIESVLLNKARFQQCKNENKTLFIKPRRGAASFSSFPLSDEITWDFIVEQQQAMKADAQFSSMFLGNYDFVAEGFVTGQEFSYEVVLLEGQVYLMAIHEKVGLKNLAFSVLETAFLSPPIAPITQHWSLARAKIAEAMQVLGLENGVFHIEGRYDLTAKHFDFIEINPRMGGSLINHSVEIVTQGYSMLTLWVQLMLVKSAEQKMALKALLERLEYSSEHSPVSSYIQIYYAESGKVIKTVEKKHCELEPKTFLIHMKEKMATPNSNREIFAAEGVWQISRTTREEEVVQLAKVCEPIFELSYQ
ncbi:ATP-grasp domain-containing protein [Rheinheimera faecalis]|uniref:ATP-grasp domain-containing protein n=1 Tax=Rheinheimera faecalis TaxID=2901141 RepID=UPI001E2A493A|nr:ATP-grasp domain-containing protein [Rheinheimera faecalis]